MKKFLAMILATVMIMSCFASITFAGAETLDPNGKYVAMGPPTVDGKLDALYAQSTGYTLSKEACDAMTEADKKLGGGIVGAPELADPTFSTTFYLAVDDNNLYITEYRRDNTPVYGSKNFTEPYKGDGSLLWFTTAGKTDPVAGIQWNRALADSTTPVFGVFYDNNKQAAGVKQDIEYVVTDVEGGYILETKFPLETLKFSKQDLLDGKVMFTFCSVDIINPDYNPDKFGWANTGYQAQYPGVGNWAKVPALKGNTVGGAACVLPTVNSGEVPPVVDNRDEQEMTPTAHSKPIFGCNTEWSGWTVDTENQQAGSGCLTTVYKKGGSVISQVVLDTPVNATGMDTLELEFYVSDLKMLEMGAANSMGQIEISSSGKCDVNELAIEWKPFCELLIANGAKVGWNHVAIPLSKMSSTGGEIDLSNVNFVRIYMNNTNNWADGDEFTVKIDNLRLTDAQAQAAAAEQAKREQFEKDNAKLIAALEELKMYDSKDSISEKTVATVKATIEAIQKKVDALTGDAATYIKDYTGPLTKAKKAVEDYEKDIADAEAAAKAKADAIKANQALYDAIKALLTTGITDENYESAKAAVDSAMTGWDALSAEVKGYFEEDGLKTTLDAAKAAVDAFTPTPVTPPVEDNGCKSSLTAGAGAMILLLGAWVAISSRKKEN